MTIFDDYLFLKSYKGVPLIFFSSKFRSPKLKKNHRFFRGGGAVPENKIGKIGFWP